MGGNQTVEQPVVSFHLHLDTDIPFYDWSFVDIVLDQCFVESRIVRRVLFPADTGVTFLHIRGYAFGAFLVGGSERKVVARYTGKYFRVDDSFADIERLCLCNDFVVAVEEDRKNIQLQCFCQVESSFVETLHLSVVSACTFGEDSDGVALFYFFPHPFHILFVAFAYVIEIDIADDCSEERRMPYPMIGYHQDFRRKRQQYQNIDERLVVGDNNCRMLKTFVSFVDMFFFNGSGQQQNPFAGDLYQSAYQTLFAAFPHRHQIKDSDQYTEEDTTDKEKQEEQYGPYQPDKRIRRQSFGSGSCNEEPENEWLNGIGNQHYCYHAENGNQ